MQHAVENAGELGIRILQSVREHGDQAWKEGTAFLMSALEDSRTFIQQAPPDNRHMKDILCWNILLRLAIEGHELSLDLEELKRTREQLAMADEISTIIGVPPPKTYLRQTQETALRLYAAATTEWGDIIARRDASNHQRHEDAHEHDHPRSVDSEISAWMEGLSLDGGGGEDSCKSHTHRMHPKISSNYVELYQCSWCKNPSAVLRKCSGCTVTRYCDGQCQKSHWKEHKRVCKEK